MILITAKTGTPHVTPLQDSMCNRGVAGRETCAYNKFEVFTPQIISNNEVRIRSGAGMIQGREFCIEPNTYDAVTIANGAQGEKRIDLIVIRFEANNELRTQDADWAVIQGAPAASDPQVPAHTVGDIDDGDLIAEEPWIEVELDGINIVEVRPVFTVSATLEDSRISAETLAAYEAIGFDTADYPGGGQIDKLDRFIKNRLGVQMVKVWENASPGSSFAAQTVSIPITGDLVGVLFRPYNTSSMVLDMYIFKKTGIASSAVSLIDIGFSPYNMQAISRSVAVSETIIEFGSGYTKRTNAGAVAGTTNNTAMIPIEIYEFKGVV